jgi:drug/metabolite transporter (DMT)-like permease
MPMPATRDPVDRATSASRSTTGVILMTLAMLTIPIVDGLAKFLSASYSPLFIGWARYAVACLVVLPVAATFGGRRMFPAERLAAHALRTVFLVVAMTLYFLAVARIPLATAASASFVSPIIAVILSVLVLHERLTPAKLLSLAVGFVGSLVILRPGGTIDPGLVLAFAAGLFFACYMIATRHASKESEPVKTLALQCALGAALLTPQALLSWSTPAPSDWIYFVGIGVCSAVSHLLSIAAFRWSEASTLAPLVYIELVGATAIGYLVFGEIPDAPTLIGAALIVSAGLLLIRR